jgi:hypothetical protein
MFEPNRGQAASSVRFLSRGNGHSFLLSDKEAVLQFADSSSTIRMKLLDRVRNLSSAVWGFNEA